MMLYVSGVTNPDRFASLPTCRERVNCVANDETQKLNATEQAYRSIRAKIVSAEYREGERLTEKRLSDELGLSRTPIREAIGRLILEGFIEN